MTTSSALDTVTRNIAFNSTSGDNDASGDDDASDFAPDPNTPTRKGKYAYKSKRMPSLIDTLATCYLGTLLLRRGTSIGDFHKFVTKPRR